MGVKVRTQLCLIEDLTGLNRCVASQRSSACQLQLPPPHLTEAFDQFGGILIREIASMVAKLSQSAFEAAG